MNSNAVKAGARHSVSDTQLLAQAQAILTALGAPVDDAPVKELDADVLAGRSVENYLSIIREAFEEVAVPSDWQDDDGYPTAFWVQETYATSAIVSAGYQGQFLAPYSFDIEGNCVVSPISEWKPVKRAWATKSLSMALPVKKSDDEFVFGAYGILYGDAKTPDLTGDFFTKNTDLMLDEWDKRPVLYHHAMDTQTKASPVVGTVTGVTRDPVGVWVEAQLNMRHQYAEGVKQLIEAGALSYSSDSTAHLVSRKSHPNGATELTRWAAIAWSLTPTPAEFRLMPVEAVKTAYADAGIDLPKSIEPASDKADKADETKETIKAAESVVSETPQAPKKNVEAKVNAEATKADENKADNKESHTKTAPKPKTPKVNRMFKNYDEIVAAATQAALEGKIDESDALVKQANAVKAAMALQSDAPRQQAARPPFFNVADDGQQQPQTYKKSGKPEDFLFYNAVKSLMGRVTDKINIHIEGQQVIVDSTREAIKAMTGDSASTGGTWIPNIQSDRILDFLYGETVLRKAGITVIPMADSTGGSITIPSFTSGFTANWVGASSAATSNDAATGSVTLSPHELVSMATLAKSLLNDSNPQIESYIRSGLASAIGEKLDLAGIEGSGTSPEPRGLRNTNGVVTTALGAQTIFDALIDASARMSKNRIPGQKRVFICRPEVFYGMLKAKDSTGQYVVTGGYEGQNASADPLPMLRRLGIPVYTTTTIKDDAASGAAAKSRGYLLYAPELLMADRQSLEMAGSDVAGDAFEKRQFKLLATLRADYALGRASACEIISDILH